MGSRWFMLGVLFVARTAVGFQFQSVASTAPAMIADFHLDYAAIGMLIGFYNLPGILMALPSGLFGRRFGDRAIYAAGLLLMAAGGAVMGTSDGLALATCTTRILGMFAVSFEGNRAILCRGRAAPLGHICPAERNCHGPHGLVGLAKKPSFASSP